MGNPVTYFYTSSNSNTMNNKFLLLTTLVAALPLSAADNILILDNWADGDRTNGADANDVAWYPSTSSSGIEVGQGFLGLVSGGSSRSIHAVFADTTLNVGDTIVLTATFTTPATVGDNRGTAFRIGMFNSNGADVSRDVTSSTDPAWSALTGYMTTFDINTGTELITHRERIQDGPDSDRQLSRTSNFVELGEPGGSPFTMLANTSYTLTYSFTLTDANTLTMESSLATGGVVLTQFTQADTLGPELTFDMLAIQSNARTFGSVNDPDVPDNGIDFTEIALRTTVAPIIPDETGPGVLAEFERVGDHVFTGDWLGWIVVEPYPWIYVYSQDGWFFLEESSYSDHGAWLYSVR